MTLSNSVDMGGSISREMISMVCRKEKPALKELATSDRQSASWRWKLLRRLAILRCTNTKSAARKRSTARRPVTGFKVASAKMTNTRRDSPAEMARNSDPSKGSPARTIIRSSRLRPDVPERLAFSAKISWRRLRSTSKGEAFRTTEGRYPEYIWIRSAISLLRRSTAVRPRKRRIKNRKAKSNENKSIILHSPS